MVQFLRLTGLEDVTNCSLRIQLYHCLGPIQPRGLPTSRLELVKKACTTWPTSKAATAET